MAKVRLALRALDDVLDDLPEHITKLRASSGLNPTLIDLEFSGSIALDKEGGVDIGGEASANLATVAAGAGVPASIKAGFGSKWDNQGGASWRLAVKFG